ncbi:Rho1 guanine nucleotide exchange factor 2 [Smittium mucronatum]|uniref:Rho1 guanine nucleotide exchange factor 2 n=1 Tax=Smittium mucronatum TaxID=133383 RepID=A0A1R0GYN9_9FUNG|nr:Rho1 guanine nucleotide exchange factor 2 [Smittium mucronatum]
MHRSQTNKVDYNSPLNQKPGKLASPGLELKQKFLNSLVIGNFYYKGIKYSGAFTGRHAIDTITDSFGLPDRLLSLQVAKKLDQYNIYQSINNESDPNNNCLIDSSDIMYILSKEAFSCLLPSPDILLNNKKIKNPTNFNPKIIPPAALNELSISAPKNIIKYPLSSELSLIDIDPKSPPLLSKKHANNSEALEEFSFKENNLEPFDTSSPLLPMDSHLLVNNELNKEDPSHSIVSSEKSSQDKAHIENSDITLRLNVDFEKKLSIDIDKLIRSPDNPIIYKPSKHPVQLGEEVSNQSSADRFSILNSDDGYFSQNIFNSKFPLHRISDATIIDPALPISSYYNSHNKTSLIDTNYISSNRRPKKIADSSDYNIMSNRPPLSTRAHRSFSTKPILNRSSSHFSFSESKHINRGSLKSTRSASMDSHSFDSSNSKENAINLEMPNTSESIAKSPKSNRKNRDSELFSIFSFENYKFFNSNPFKNISRNINKNRQPSKSSSIPESIAASLSSPDRSSYSSSENNNPSNINLDESLSAQEPLPLSKKQSLSSFLNSKVSNFRKAKNEKSNFKNDSVYKETPSKSKKSIDGNKPVLSSKKSKYGRDAAFEYSQLAKKSPKLKRQSKSVIDLSSSVNISSHPISLINSQSDNKKSNDRRPTLWAHTVSQEVLDNLTPDEIGWQESIYETIVTESDYMHDLKLIDQLYVEPLRSSNIIPKSRFDDFIEKLFLNYKQLIKSNLELLKDLETRQAQSPNGIIHGIGDIFLKWSDNIEPFIYYSANVQFAQVALEAEMHENQSFSDFIYSTESNVLSRRLPIQSFISRPTAKFARYPMLLSSVLKRTPREGFEDEVSNLEYVISVIKSTLEHINEINATQVNKLRLMRLTTQIRTTAEEAEILDIGNENRKLLLEDDFYRNDGSILHAFLFDNCFILANKKKVSHAKGVFEYIVQKGPLPLMLLNVNALTSNNGELIHPLVPKKTPFGRLPTIISKQSSQTSQQSNSAVFNNVYSSTSSFANNTTNIQTSSSSNSTSNIQNYANQQYKNGSSPALLSKKSTSAMSSTNNVFALNSAISTILIPGNVEIMSNCAPLAFGMISKLGWEVTLWAANVQSRNMWVERVNEQVQILNNLTSSKLRYNLVANKSNLHLEASCISEYISSDGQMIKLIGAVDGIYMLKSCSMDRATKVCNLNNVTNLAVLEHHNMVIVQHERTVAVIPLNELENFSTWNLQSRGTKLASLVSYFNVGIYQNEPLLVLMKFRNNRSYFKCLQPVMVATASSSSSSVMVYQNYPFALNVIHEFCIPGQSTRVFFFKRKLCIANGNCFDVVDLANKVITQSLPSIDAGFPDELGKISRSTSNQTNFSASSGGNVVGKGGNDNSSIVSNGIDSLAMAIYRINKLFLLCFEDFALYIDRMGQLTQPNLVINFLVKPISFKFVHPNYLVIVGKLFLEIRFVDTGNLFLILRIPDVHILDDGQHLLSSSSKQKLTNINSPKSPSSSLRNREQTKRSVFLSMQSKYLPDCLSKSDPKTGMAPDSDSESAIEIHVDSNKSPKNIHLEDYIYGKTNGSKQNLANAGESDFTDAKLGENPQSQSKLYIHGSNSDLRDYSQQSFVHEDTLLSSSSSPSPIRNSHPGSIPINHMSKRSGLDKEFNLRAVSDIRRSISRSNTASQTDLSSNNSQSQQRDKFNQRQDSQSTFITRHKSSLNNMGGSQGSGFFSSFLGGNGRSNSMFNPSDLGNGAYGTNPNSMNFGDDHYCVVELVLP